TAFASPAIAMRLEAAEAKVVIVDADQRSKLDGQASEQWRIVTIGDERRDGDLAFPDVLASNKAVAPVAPRGDAAFILMLTSGTTGAPKGVPTPVRAVAHMVAYMEYGFDIRADDVYWNAAAPGWAYGLFYAIVAPLALGRPNILLHAAASPQLTWQVLAQ